MFGKKKNQNSQPLTEPSNNTSVHTMQDDIDTMNGKPQAAPEQVNTPASNPFGDVQQPTVETTPQEPVISEPIVVAAVAKKATSQEPATEEIADVGQATSEPNTLDHSNPFADGEEATGTAPSETASTPSLNETPESSTNAPVLDTSNPFADAANTPAPTVATSEPTPPSTAPEASPASVSMAAQQLADNSMPAATPPPTSSIPESSPFNTPPATPVANPFPQTPTTGNPPTLENEISKIQQEYGEAQSSDDAPKAKRSSCMSFIFIILIVLIIAGGGYYYWMSQTPDADTSLVEIGKDAYNDIVNDVTNEETDQQTQEYSETLPHYILIDTQSDTALDDFSQEIETITTNISTQQPLSAISFIITDESGAPLSFDRFALLTGIELPQEVLEQIDESFLLYSYYDDGDVRFGLSAQTIDPDLAFNAMRDAEPTLVTALRPLFAGEVPETTTPSFTDGSYNETPIRYANLNATETLSIDYATYSGDLVIGTSKGTIRAIINTL